MDTSWHEGVFILKVGYYDLDSKEKLFQSITSRLECLDTKHGMWIHIGMECRILKLVTYILTLASIQGKLLQGIPSNNYND